MGFTAAAIAVAAGAAVSAGVGAYGASKAKSAAGKASSTARGMIDPSIINPRQAQLDAIKANLKNFPQISALTGEVNDFNQSEIGRILPGYQNIKSVAMRNTLDWLHGKIPNDVTTQVENAAATKALRFGGGSGNAVTGTLQPRDLGLTSLSLMSQGENSAQRWIALAHSMLFDPSTMFLTPRDVLASQQSQLGAQEKQAGIYLGGQAAQSEADQAMYSSIGQGIQGIVGSLAGGMGGAGGAAGGAGGFSSAGMAAHAAPYAGSVSRSGGAYYPVAAKPVQNYLNS